jgi:hypothetical protein
MDILFAGFADMSERLHAAHSRIQQLSEQVELAGNGGGTSGSGNGGTSVSSRQATADAAMYLLFFLAFINVAGWIALWQAQAAIASATAVPWWGALGAIGGGNGALAVSRSAPFFAVALKRIVLFAVPLTNTAVVLTFCVAAVRAALALVRSWE